MSHGPARHGPAGEREEGAERASGMGGEGREAPSSAVAREYRRLARAYDERWAGYLRETVRMTLQALGPQAGDRILDVGCGTGLVLRQVQGEVDRASLHGSDLSPAMLQVAGERLEGRVRLLQARAEVLPYADESFDAVISSSVLHYVPEPEAALGEVRRVLRPGGRLVLTDWSRDYLAMKILDAWLRWRDPAHVRTHSRASVVAMLEEVGLRPLSVDEGRAPPLWGIMTVAARR